MHSNKQTFLTLHLKLDAYYRLETLYANLKEKAQKFV